MLQFREEVLPPRRGPVLGGGPGVLAVLRPAAREEREGEGGDAQAAGGSRGQVRAISNKKKIVFDIFCKEKTRINFGIPCIDQEGGGRKEERRRKIEVCTYIDCLQ